MVKFIRNTYPLAPIIVDKKFAILPQTNYIKIALNNYLHLGVKYE